MSPTELVRLYGLAVERNADASPFNHSPNSGERNIGYRSVGDQNLEFIRMHSANDLVVVAAGRKRQPSVAITTGKGESRIGQRCLFERNYGAEPARLADMARIGQKPIRDIRRRAGVATVRVT